MRQKKRRPREDGDRDWHDAATSQGTSRIAGHGQVPGEAWNRLSEPPEGTNPTYTLILDFWPPELRGDTFLFFKLRSLW